MKYVLLLAIPLAGMLYYFFGSFSINKTLDEAIETKIEEELAALDLQADSIHVDFVSKKITLQNWDLIPLLTGDSLNISTDEKGHNLKLDHVTLSGIDWWEIRDARELIVDTIFLKSSSIDINTSLFSLLDTTQSVDMKRMKANTVIVQVDSFSLIDSIFGFDALRSATNLLLETSDLDWTRTSEFDLSLLERLSASMREIKAFDRQNSLAMSIDSFNYGNAELFLQNILAKPTRFPRQYIAATELKITEIDYLKLWNESTFRANNLLVGGVELNANSNWLESIQRQSNEKIKTLNLDKLTLRSRKISWNQNRRGYIKDAFTSESGEITASAISIDLNTDDYYTLADKLKIKLRKFKKQARDALHLLSIAELQVSKNEIITHSFTMTPVVSRENFYSNPARKQSLYNIQIPTIVYPIQNLQSLLKTPELVSEKIHVSGAIFNIYTNLNIRPAKKYHRLLSEILLQFDLPVNIAELTIDKSKVNFDLKAKDRDDVGSLVFSNVNGSISNIINRKADIAKDHSLKLKVNCLFMNQANFNLEVDFDLLNPEMAYSYYGKLENLNLVDVTRLFEDLAATQMKSGYLNFMDFSVKANKYRSYGTMNLYYENLKLRFEKDRSTGIKDPIRFLMNRFILRQNNRKGRNPQFGRIKTERDPFKSMLFQIWNSILEGIKSVLLPDTILTRK